MLKERLQGSVTRSCRDEDRNNAYTKLVLTCSSEEKESLIYHAPGIC
jgi:hypothetical protein